MTLSLRQKQSTNFEQWRWLRPIANALKSAPFGLGVKAAASIDNGLREAIENWNTPAGKRYLALGADPTQESFNGISYTCRCARIGNAELIAWLCHFGADPNLAGNEQWAPLHHASAKGHRAAIEALIFAGADASAKANNGWTPLMLAAKENRLEAIDALCLAKCAIDDPDARGESPLLLCARKGFLDAARLLLKHGADILATERRGFQAIHLAAAQGHDEICKCLIEAGADPGSPGPWSKTPAGLARAEGHASTVALLEQAILQNLDDGQTESDTGSQATRNSRRL